MFCGSVTQRVAIGSCRGSKGWPLSLPAGDSGGAASGSLLGVNSGWMKIFHPPVSGKGRGGDLSVSRLSAEGCVWSLSLYGTWVNTRGFVMC